MRFRHLHSLLSDPADVALICEGMRLARKIAAAAPLAAFNAGELRPGPRAKSDGAFLVYAAERLQTVYHPTSTCRIGSDERAVVDSQLRVRGVDGLWVCGLRRRPNRQTARSIDSNLRLE